MEADPVMTVKVLQVSALAGRAIRCRRAFPRLPGPHATLSSHAMLEQTMGYLAFRIDAPRGDIERAPEQSVGRVRMEAMSVWDDGPPQKDRSP